MRKKHFCNFCEIAKGKVAFPEYDRPLFANDAFFAIPSVGAMVEGWMLIIPRKHCLSMKDMYDDPRFFEMMHCVYAVLKEVYGNVVMFEHGCAKEGSLTGCGANHAHVHLLPFKESLIEDLGDSGFCWERCLASEISEIVGSDEYLFYSDLDEDGDLSDVLGFVHVLRNETSQFFRRVIAKRLGMEMFYDYKKYLFLESVSRGIKKISDNKLLAENA